MSNTNPQTEHTFLYGNNHNQDSNFKQLTWNELVTKITHPRKYKGKNKSLVQIKKSAPVIGAHDGINKLKADVIKHDNFTMLRIDLDDTPLDIDVIEEQLKAMSIEQAIIHSTASHQQEECGNRYRVFISLAHSIGYSEWQMLSAYLAQEFLADDCGARPAQIMYLPLSVPCMPYEYRIIEGKPLNTKEWAHREKAEALLKAQLAQAEKTMLKASKPSYSPKLIKGQYSAVDLVEQSFTWENLLSSYGYKQQGRAWLAPESQTKTAGAYILPSNDGKERLYSHHSSDPCAVGKAIDKFDLITIRQCGGVFFEAVKYVMTTHFPEHDRHNKKVGAISIANKELLAEIGGAK